MDNNIEELDPAEVRGEESWGWQWAGPAIRKAAIAGAAVAAAPIVLPPAMLLSAVGAALSVPFGVYLGAVVCTDKLMSSLLRFPSAQGQQEGEDEEEDMAVRLGDEDNEVLYNEEEIWQEIEELRTIIGCEATIQASYVEELRAILLLTGVEPPSSLREPADLLEVTGNLQFLKLLVGIR